MFGATKGQKMIHDMLLTSFLLILQKKKEEKMDARIGKEYVEKYFEGAEKWVMYQREKDMWDPNTMFHFETVEVRFLFAFIPH